ncbi:MAG: SUF system NifU family Fe-S cluster assembly protein [Acetobacteraceae bacterium]|nr:SUF system NifU family Fe-S cluster assembly protein [Acetobacteraceae bacterium]
MFDPSTLADVRALYSDAIRQHGRHPGHAGRLAEADGVAKGDNPMCGDRVQVFIRRAGSTISEASFEARGCEISLASADLMCEAVAGQPIDRVRDLAGEVEAMARTGRCDACDDAMTRLQPLAAVHEFPSRVKCVTLPWRALIAAVDGLEEATSE